MNLTELNTISRTGAFRIEDEGDGIARLVFDLPEEKVNKLTAAVLEDLERILEAIARDSTIKAVIIWGGKEASGTFIAGADLGEIRSVTSAADGSEKARRGQQILGKLAAMPQVTIAAIHGNCLGGGTELALACDLRVASHSPKTRIGLPEVQLGILPGFGGTQRLPRLVGIQRALPLILSGKPQTVAQAARIGLVDRVVYPDLLRREARALANQALSNGGKRYRPARKRLGLLTRLLERFQWGRSIIRKISRRSIRKLTGTHYPAPYKALDSVIDGFGMSLGDGLANEASLVGDLIVSPIAKNLMDLFLASEEARRGRRDESQRDSCVISMQGSAPKARSACGGKGRVALLGAGVMGGGIAALLVQKGYRVRMKDITSEALQLGLKKIHELLGELQRKKRISRREASNHVAAISVTTDTCGLEACDFVIEAVVESMEVKKKVLREVEERVSSSTVIATNTSALSVTEMQSALANPARLVGLHFFNPVGRMPLVEIVRGRMSSEGALRAAEALARDLGKVPVRVEDGPGFLVNRLLAPYLNEAVRLFEESYSPVAIDRAARSFGMPMGPFELLDEIGLDVAAKVAHTLHQSFGVRAKPPESMDRLVAAQLLGKKSGKGFYHHRRSVLAWRSKLTLNREVLGIVGNGGKGFLPDVEALWMRRLVFPIINEAARALDERIVEKASRVDLAMVLGTGFAPFRGGPLHHADAVGLKEVVAFLEGTGEERHKPCELLARLAREDVRFLSPERAAVAVAHG